MKEPDYSSRVRGCLLGGAIGDAFGYEVEFDSLARIRQRFGPAGMVEPVRHRGRLVVSDDTQMTLFTAEGLLRARSAGCLADLDATLEHLRLATLDWYLTQSCDPAQARDTGALGRSRVMQARRAPDNTCLSACAKGAWGSPGRPINDSKAAIVRALVDGLGLAEAASAALTLLRSTPRSGPTVAALVAASAHGASVQGLGEGWVGEEALAVGYHAALVGEGFAGAVRLAANHSGDSDSTASIAGQVLGAALGAEVIPEGWEEGLDCAVELSEMARELA